MSDIAISARGLRKMYGEHAAVAGIDLEVYTGETFALLGPNGAGKTTATEIFEGYRDRDAGEVRVLGHDPAIDDRSWRNRIGIVLQTSTGLDLLTPREALASTAKVYSNPRDVDEVITAVGLTEKADARVRTLSGGQRRRLDVGLGIIGSPELLFLDEPTTGFDPQARRDFWELIHSLADDGTTILLTTHYLEEAEHLADRLGVIAGGEIIALDTPENLGGRGQSAATVTWDEGGRRRLVETLTPTALVAELTGRLAGPDGEVPGLTVTRPSLEDTYLRLVGTAAQTTSTSQGAPA